MLGGHGPYRGWAIMISGESGTGKSCFAAAFADAAARGGDQVLYLSFEEASAELLRNQRSVGIDLAEHLAAEGGSGRLTLMPLLAVELGWEEHLLRVMRAVQDYRPGVVVIDPASALSAGNAGLQNKGLQGKEMLLRLFYMLKREGVTAVATELLPDYSGGYSEMEVSSIVDVWLKLRRDERSGQLHRLLNVVKARGLPTSERVGEFWLTGGGVRVAGGRAGHPQPAADHPGGLRRRGAVRSGGHRHPRHAGGHQEAPAPGAPRGG